MLLYPHSGQLTLSIGLLGIEDTIADSGYSGVDYMEVSFLGEEKVCSSIPIK